MADEQKKLFEKAKALLSRGYPKDAAVFLQTAIDEGYRTPGCYSLLGLAIARSGGDHREAEGHCKAAIAKEFYWPQFYLNLAEVYLIADKKVMAIKTLESGLAIDKDNRSILAELGKLGCRKPPVLSFLSRTNPVNKGLGILMSRLGFRS